MTKLAGKMAADMDSDEDGGTRRRTRLPAAQRRETILRAATGVFAQAGYRAAKVSDVAERVGVTEPVIFQNFGSKAALFAAVVERAAAEVRASLDDLAAGPGQASELLAHILAASSSAHAHLGRPANPAADKAETGHAGAAHGVLFAHAAALAADPELTGPASDAVRAVVAHLADLIRHAQADGGVRPDADPEVAAWLLLSVMSARRLRAAAMPPGLEPAVIALVLGALTPAAADVPGRDQAPRDVTGRPGGM